MTTTTYAVVANFLVEGPPEHKRAVEKFVHALVQSLVSERVEVAGGEELAVVGASATLVAEGAK